MGRVANLIDAVITGRPPRVIERQFGWLRKMGYAVDESGWRGMELYATYASNSVLVRVLEDYHYGYVGVWLARARSEHAHGPDIDLIRLLTSRVPDIRWDGNYDVSDPGAGEAKLAEAARLLREHCAEILKGENLAEIDR